MATKTIVTCDLHGDGVTAGRSVTIDVDGKSYAVDLCDSHAKALDTALAPYISAARAGGRAARAGGRARGGRSQASTTRADLGEIRAWARKQGWDVSDRGRVAREIVDSFDEAQRRRSRKHA